MAETTEARLRRWQTRIDAARHIRQQWEVSFRVKELERFYLGKMTEDRDDQQEFWLNHFFATVQVQKPTLLPRSTSFLIKPKAGREPFGTVESQIQEAVLKAISEQDDNLFTDASLALSQAFFRIGVIKMAYEPLFEPNPRAGEPLPDEQGMLDAGDTQEDEPREVLTDEVYSFAWVDAAKMLLPDEGPNMRRWTWIAEEIEVTMDEAKADERFKPSLRSHLKPNATADPQAHAGDIPPDTGTAEDEEHARFCYVEAYDVANKRLLAWATGQDFEDFLIDEPLPHGVEDHPYALLRFIPILAPEPMAWPKPVTYDWLPMQQQYNIVRQMQVNAAKRAARKFLYEETTFPDEEELDKFTSSADMQGVSVTDLGRPPVMFGDSIQNPDVARNVPFLINDWRIVTGAAGTRLGDPDADTATEAVLIEQSSSLRDSEARLVVDKWIAQAGKKMLQLVKQTLTMDLWVQIRGFSDDEFQEFLRQPAVQTMLALQVGAENVAPFLTALEINPILQQRFRERFGKVKPLQVSRTQLQFEAEVDVLPSAARPLQQAQLLRLASVLGPLVFTSPTFLEELLASFDLPQGDRIAEEIMINLRNVQQQQQQQGGQAPQGSANGAQRTMRTGPLGTVGGRVGL